jgi:hypothetical protein
MRRIGQQPGPIEPPRRLDSRNRLQALNAQPLLDKPVNGFNVVNGPPQTSRGVYLSTLPMYSATT